MTIVAIDLGSACVGLACREGEILRVAKLPAKSPQTGWPEWITRMNPTPPYELVFRGASSTGAIEELAQSHGATRLRTVALGASYDPALTLLRAMMPRLRVGVLCFLEVGARRWQCGVLDRRGRLAAHRFGERSDDGASGDFEPLLAESITACIGVSKDSHGDTAAPDLIVAFGGQGPSLAANVADLCGLTRVFVPDYAATLGAVGMLMQDRALEFREPMPPQSPDVTALRYAFARLMDTAAHAVTMEGFDIDDTICERYAEMGTGEPEERLNLCCEALTDAEGLIGLCRREYRRSFGRETPPDDFRVLAAGLRVTIQSHSPMLPPMAWRSISQDGSSVTGPIELQEDGMTIEVPSTWHARTSPVGGVLLEHAAQSSSI